MHLTWLEDYRRPFDFQTFSQILGPPPQSQGVPEMAGAMLCMRPGVTPEVLLRDDKALCVRVRALAGIQHQRHHIRAPNQPHASHQSAPARRHTEVPWPQPLPRMPPAAFKL